ncbi:hypothetical protein OE749_00910 [Aestuariibacter sp. AA17]|uniref:Toxin CptA n=1 Tax=Fluctibacter corallii TaxID=2984329 RepID=A0ABT3A3M4_9ALTE|nr:protein YgfX [Aestuariibacter sp. AA17]MCV2883253.1 hypothetical protein [Aestuariibacter sp. AA17]
MLKFNILVTPSYLKAIASGIVAAFCLASVWMWQPSVFEYQIAAQFTVSVIIALAAVFHVIGLFRPNQLYWLFLEEEGVVRFREDAYRNIILPSSLVGPWAVKLVMLQENNRKRRVCWLAKDQVDHQAFRRLCRVVNTVKHTRSSPFSLL